MPIKLKDLSEIATVIKTKYGNNLNHMNFIFCFKKDARSYFIYQEIQGMPIKRIVHHESNNSVTFTASWAAWANPYAMIADANYDQIESWKDLQDRSRPYNSFIKEGGFSRGHWASVNRRNKTEKKKKHKTKYDTFVEFRVDKINRANFNDWGFELYSPTISMIGISRKHSFPYDVENIPDTFQSVPTAPTPTLNPNYSYGFNQQPVVQNEYSATVSDDDGISFHRVSWQGGSFRIPEFDSEEGMSQVSNPLGIPGGNGCDLSSYWSAEESEDDDAMFSEEITNMLQDEEDVILDVGQKKVNLFFGD
jgi:hypothetical protein